MGTSQVFARVTIKALIATIIIASCIRWIDYPVALAFLRTSKQASLLGKIFSGHVIVFGEILLIAALVSVRLRTGHLPELAKVTLIACNASIVAYAFNDLVLKLAFGRQSPSNFYQMHIGGIFHLFQGTESSSFPSGHMMLVAPFLGVFYRVYPRLRAEWVSLLTLGAVTLVIGDWHFISDVIAGALLGLAAGFIAGELWIKHTTLMVSAKASRG